MGKRDGDAPVHPGSARRIAPAVISGSGLVSGQAIRFFSHRGGRVAYAVTGSGPLLLLDVSRAHHLEAFWRHPHYRLLVQRLSQRFAVVRWDRPGFGLSDRDRVDLSTTGDAALVERLVAELGATSVTALAAGDAAPGMIRFAARSPERVARLALFGAAAAVQPPVPSLEGPALDALAAAGPAAIHEVVAAAQAAGCPPEMGDWLPQALEASAHVDVMVRLVAGSPDCDATPDARLVRTPTLVLHRARDAVVEPRLGMRLASLIPGAEYVELDGSCHHVYAGDTDSVLAALLPFLLCGEPGERSPLSRRELEVAEMVTLGLTNAEIGRRLAIRRRTVDAHMEHIRTKLGVSSRTRIAAWAVRNRRAGAAPGRA